MSWFTDVEQAAVEELKRAKEAYDAALAQPLIPQIKQKLDDARAAVDVAKSTITELEPFIAIIEAIYPQTVPVVTAVEGAVNTADTAVDTVDTATDATDPNAPAAQ